VDLDNRLHTRGHIQRTSFLFTLVQLTNVEFAACSTAPTASIASRQLLSQCCQNPVAVRLSLVQPKVQSQLRVTVVRDVCVCMQVAVLNTQASKWPLDVFWSRCSTELANSGFRRAWHVPLDTSSNRHRRTCTLGVCCLRKMSGRAR
jgi:hypothetical protein